MAHSDPLVVMGRIKSAFGVKGWLHVEAFTQDAQSLFDYPCWQVQHGQMQRELKLKAWRKHGSDGWVVQFEGVDDRTAAQTLTQAHICVPRRELPQLADGEYYWSDLLDMQVVNREGALFGRVTQVDNFGASDVLFVQGERRYQIPLVHGYSVLAIDTVAKQITVDWSLDD